MKKTYRISAFNRATEKRELLYVRYTSKKKAQEMADAMNRLDTQNIVQAKVIVECK